MNFGLIIIGDEILSGKREDKHLPKVIALLAARGLALSWVRMVGDDRARITACLQEALASGDVVFSCGGIGATPDDHTRQCAAAAAGLDLVLHPQAQELILARIREYDAERGVALAPDHPDTLQRLQMGVFPVGAEIIPNPYNKIPGFALRRADVGGAVGAGVYFVPGFPVMAWPMIEWVLDTHCAHLHTSQVQREQSVIVFGAIEAALTPLMEAIEAEFDGIKVFSLPSVDHPQWGRHIELGVKGDAADLGAAYARLLEGLRTHGAELGPELVR
jgi:molybdopterin-biosynthesis enzyme MoeA-like protein